MGRERTAVRGQQIEIIDVRAQADTATGTSTLDGHTIATFQLSRSSGKWLIKREQPIGQGRSTGSSASTSAAGPTQARVTIVARCLQKTFGAENAGSESDGGVPHVVLAVGVDGVSAAMVEVFASMPVSSVASASTSATLRGCDAPGRDVIENPRHRSRSG